MNEIFEFQTIANPVKDITFKEKGSKFIGFATPVSDETEVKNALDEVRALHPKATHHCYAYRLGIAGEIYRTNDDGEPSGSAGLPIYNQILSHGITDLLLVVVRYYGGTKLGVSGLIKAYKESAKMTLDETEIITKELEIKLLTKFPLEKQNMVFTLLNKFSAEIKNFTAEEQGEIYAKIKARYREEFTQKLSELAIEFEFF